MISGAGTLAIAGHGTVVLTGSNTIAGGTGPNMLVGGDGFTTIVADDNCVDLPVRTGADLVARLCDARACASLCRDPH